MDSLMSIFFDDSTKNMSVCISIIKFPNFILNLLCDVTPPLTININHNLNDVIYILTTTSQNLFYILDTTYMQ